MTPTYPFTHLPTYPIVLFILTSVLLLLSDNKPGSRKSISEQLEDIFTPLEDMDTNMMRMSPSSCTPPPPSPPSSNKLASPCTRRKYNNKVTTKVNPATYENYNSSNTNNQKQQQQHQQNNNSTNVAAENQRKITTAMPVRQHQQQQQQDQHLYQQSRSVPAASCRVAVRSNLSNLSHTGGAGAVGMSPKLAPRARREVAPPPPPVTMTTVARNYGWVICTGNCVMCVMFDVWYICVVCAFQ